MSGITYLSREDGDMVATMLDWADGNNLPELTLHQSCIGDDEPPIWEGFPKDEKTLMELDHLILVEKNLYDIPNEIACMVNLKEIYLIDNSIFDIPNELLELPNLEHLDLSENYDLELTEYQIKKIEELQDKGCKILYEEYEE